MFGRFHDLCDSLIRYLKATIPYTFVNRYFPSLLDSMEQAVTIGDMYLKTFWAKNIWDSEEHSWDFSNQCNAIRRWSILKGSDHQKNTLIFKLIGICLGAGMHFPHLIREILSYRKIGEKRGYFGIILRPDTPKRIGDKNHKDIQIRYEILPEGEVRCSCANDGHYNRLSKGFNDLMPPFRNFAYGYNAQRDNSVYESLDPAQIPRLRSSRFGTFFYEDFPLTPPTDWLFRQYKNASRHNSKKAEYLYNVSISLIAGIFRDLKSFYWDQDNALYFVMSSNALPVSGLPKRNILLIDFLVDLVRQMADSKLTSKDFNLCEGILFIDYFEKLFRSADNLSVLETLSHLFPNMQFIVSCYEQGLLNHIKSLESGTVPSSSVKTDVSQWISTCPSRAKLIRQKKNHFLKTRFKKSSPASEDAVVLIDVDSAIPNLALMKLSRYYKQQGRTVILTRDSSGHLKSRFVFASCIFKQPNTDKKIERLRFLHEDNIRIGGSGVDLSLRLPEEIESLMPDYDLYPGMDYAMGFLTRGCPHKCNHCVVPVKEGALRLAAHIDEILPPGQKKLVLLDDNLLAYPGVNGILREMIDKKLQINFNQSLDIRHLDPEKARLLQMIDSRNFTFTKRMYYFSMKSSDLIPVVDEKIKLLKSLKRSEIMFICMYGYNTTLSDDIKRFSFLQKLAVSPFVQEFKPINNMLLPVVKNYFDTEIDPLLKIYFRQNGRNFELFLKWVSKKYAEEFGEIHMPLVDLIFKYNNKQHKHRYIATILSTRQ